MSIIILIANPKTKSFFEIGKVWNSDAVEHFKIPYENRFEEELIADEESEPSRNNEDLWECWGDYIFTNDPKLRDGLQEIYSYEDERERREHLVEDMFIKILNFCEGQPVRIMNIEDDDLWCTLHRFGYRNTDSFWKIEDPTYEPNPYIGSPFLKVPLL